jgi:hypothetical protein
MQTTDGLRNAVAEQREAVSLLSDALLRYQQAGASLEGTAFELDLADGPADRYLQTSARVGDILIAACQADPEDGDAMARLIAAVTVDAKVAEQAALLAMMVEPLVPDGQAMLPELAADQIADLGESLAEAAGPLLDEIERGDTSGGADAGEPPPDPPFEDYVKEILEKASGDIIGTASAAVPFAHQVQSLLGQGAIAMGPALLDRALHGLKVGWHALRRLALRAWQWLLNKLGVVGTGAGQIGNELAGEGHDLISRLTNILASAVLGGILNSTWVIDDGNRSLAGASQADQDRALAACPDVVAHLAKRQRPVPLLNKTLSLLSTLHAPGLVAGALGAAVLLIYSSWNAHDHIDSPKLPRVRIPGNPGLLQAVRAALPPP